MNDKTGFESQEAPEGEEVETGEPITLLEDVEQEISPVFLDRVRSRIERRTLSSQAVSLCWELPILLLLEVLNVFFEVLTPPEDRKGGSQ